MNLSKLIRELEEEKRLLDNTISILEEIETRHDRGEGDFQFDAEELRPAAIGMGSGAAERELSSTVQGSDHPDSSHRSAIPIARSGKPKKRSSPKRGQLRTSANHSTGGLIRHPELSPQLIERIRQLYGGLQGILPVSLKAFIDGFQRDEHPEEELKKWEATARVYAQYVDRVKLDDDQRVRALRMILGISGTMTVQQMAEDLAALPPGSGAKIAAMLSGIS
jgi:hypothetical protein